MSMDTTCSAYRSRRAGWASRKLLISAALSFRVVEGLLPKSFPSPAIFGVREDDSAADMRVAAFADVGVAGATDGLESEKERIREVRLSLNASLQAKPFIVFVKSKRASLPSVESVKIFSRIFELPVLETCIPLTAVIGK
jgi:hypothetical protein